MEVKKGLLIYYLGFMTVNKIKEHLLRFTESNILRLALISALAVYGPGMRTGVSIFDFVHPYCSLFHYVTFGVEYPILLHGWPGGITST